jgi:hypothetical protein
MEVQTDQEPGEGETLIFTLGGGFSVKGSIREVAQRLAAEDWPAFELSESADTVIIRSSQVVALRGGTKRNRGSMGFVPRH